MIKVCYGNSANTMRTGHRGTHGPRNTGTKEHLDKRCGEGNEDSGLERQLEEDGVDSTRQNKKLVLNSSGCRKAE